MKAASPNISYFLGRTGHRPVSSGHWPDEMGRRDLCSTMTECVPRALPSERRVAARHRRVACATYSSATATGAHGVARPTFAGARHPFAHLSVFICGYLRL